MEFDMESLVKAPFINDEGKSAGTKGPIIEQAIFDQEELEALVAFGPRDEVIVGPYRFIASDTRLLEQTAIPVFADTDPITSLWIHKLWKGSVRANRTGLQREFLAGERPPIARKTRSELYRCARAHSCNCGPR
jgi:hypothetical protein